MLPTRIESPSRHESQPRSERPTRSRARLTSSSTVVSDAEESGLAIETKYSFRLQSHATRAVGRGAVTESLNTLVFGGEGAEDAVPIADGIFMSKGVAN